MKKYNNPEDFIKMRRWLDYDYILIENLKKGKKKEICALLKEPQQKLGYQIVAIGVIDGNNANAISRLLTDIAYETIQKDIKENPELKEKIKKGEVNFEDLLEEERNSLDYEKYKEIGNKHYYYIFNYWLKA